MLLQGWLDVRSMLGALQLLPAVTLGFPLALSQPSQAPLPPSPTGAGCGSRSLQLICEAYYYCHDRCLLSVRACLAGNNVVHIL